ncbi:DUF2461 domain-containing protein [Capnocytophaga felis]|uniref:TIGR02453 family protein n=1 Tax=Capnocytophaga felis TaxID=2267611 RepID=A0A5M4B7M0_9FLAO|nr:DUF2461 domain-containing protein [Capnocytophaga felis]GET45591.1 TIGR02453 family protein [Capnocytophaga felis]GET47246.1 TIGR02453 family protein [Capnocytophaga felis]
MEEIFSFLKELSQNNNRPWFAEHKNDYENAKAKVENFFRAIYNEIAKGDFLGEMKMYRIYKDVRFSKDKTPYKTHFGLYFPRKQPRYRGGYYVHLSPDETFVGGGFFAPNKEDLYRIRKEIELDGEGFEKVMQSEGIQKYYEGKLWGDELKTAPKEFDKNDPMIHYIRKKQFLLKYDFCTDKVLKLDFQQEVIQAFEAMRPFFDFMTTALTTNLNGESLFDQES